MCMLQVGKGSKNAWMKLQGKKKGVDGRKKQNPVKNTSPLHLECPSVTNCWMLGGNLACIPFLCQASVGHCQKAGYWTGWASVLAQRHHSCLLSKAAFLQRLYSNSSKEHDLFSVLPGSAFVYLFFHWLGLPRSVIVIVLNYLPFLKNPFSTCGFPSAFSPLSPNHESHFFRDHRAWLVKEPVCQSPCFENSVL